MQTTTQGTAICDDEPRVTEKLSLEPLRNVFEGQGATSKIIQIKNRSTNSNVNKVSVRTSNTSGKLLETFNCQLCPEKFHDQLKFFLHLKFHYEPNHETVYCGSNCSNAQEYQISKCSSDYMQEEKKFNVLKISPTKRTRQKLNVHCIQCNISFKNRKAYDVHVRDVHIKVEINEFSDYEDIMDGMETDEQNN